MSDDLDLFGPDKPIRKRPAPEPGRITYRDLYGDPNRKLPERLAHLADRPIPDVDELKNPARIKQPKEFSALGDAPKPAKKRAAPNFKDQTFRHMRNLGFTRIQPGSHYNHLTGRSHDFAGIFDWIAGGQGRTIGVQVTSKSNMSARRKKIIGSKGESWAKGAGWEILLLGFHKVNGRWVAVEEWL